MSDSDPAIRVEQHGADKSNTEPNGTTPFQNPQQACRLSRIGNYDLGPELGRGGMGIVYEATESGLDRRVAIKMLHIAPGVEHGQLRRFRNEALAVAKLNHECIVPIYHVGQENTFHYYAMKLIDGSDLGEIIRGNRRAVRSARRTNGGKQQIAQSPFDSTFPSKEPKRAGDTVIDLSASSFDQSIRQKSSSCTKRIARSVAHIGMSAANGLHHAHENGIVHRDVKPSNLMLDKEGKVWVTDFGLAQIQDTPAITRSGDIVGTLRYMSPEQAAGRRGFVDNRTDIYSLGITLYELLTLRPACRGSTAREIIREVTFERPIPIRRINSRIPKELETIICKATERNPADRYQTAAGMAEDLRRFLANEPLNAKRLSRSRRVRDWLYQRPLIASGIAGLGLMLLCGALMIAANRNSVAKETQQRLSYSEGLRMLANSALALPEDPGLATALAVLGAKAAPGFEADKALLSASDACHELRTISLGDTPAGTVYLTPSASAVVHCVPYSEYGKGSFPATAFDTSSGEQLWQLDNGNAVTSVAFSPSGQYGIAASRSVRLRSHAWDDLQHEPPMLFDVASGRKLTTFHNAHLLDSHVHYFSADSQFIVLPYEENTAAVFRCADGERELILRGHTNRVISAAFSPNSTLMATASRDNTVRVWKRAGDLQLTIEIGESLGLDTVLEFSQGGNELIIHSGSSLICYDLSQERILWKKPSRGARVSPRESLLLSSSALTLKLYQLDSGRVVRQWKPTSMVTLLEFSADGRSVFASSRENIFVYRAESGELLTTLQGHKQQVIHFSVSQQNPHLLVSCARDGTIRVWNDQSGYARRTLSKDPSPSFQSRLAYDPSGAYAIVSTMRNRTTTLLDAKTGERIGSFQGIVNRTDFSDEQLITCDGSRVFAWDPRTSQKVGETVLQDTTIHWCYGVSGGALLQTTERLLLWKTEPNEITSVTEPGQIVRHVTVAPDRSRYALGFSDGRIAIYSAGSATEDVSFTPATTVRSVDFDDQGDRLLVIDNQGQGVVVPVDEPQAAIRLDQRFASFNGHLSFSGDAIVAPVVDAEPRVGIWNAATGKQDDSFPMAEVSSLAIHQDGEHIAVGSRSTGTRLFARSTQQITSITDHPTMKVFFADEELLVVTQGCPQAHSRFFQIEQPLTDPELLIWNLETQAVRLDQAITGYPQAASMNRGSNILAVATHTYSAELFATDDLRSLATVGAHNHPLVYVGFTQQGKQVVTVSANGDIQTHGLSGELVHQFPRATEYFTAVGQSNGSDLLTTADALGTLSKWDLSNGNFVSNLQDTPSPAISQIEFGSSSGSLIAVSGQRLQHWKIGTEHSREIDFEAPITTAAFSADEQWALVSISPVRLATDAQSPTKSGTTYIIRIDDMSYRKIDDKLVVASVFSPDSQYVALVSDGDASVYEVGDLKLLQRMSLGSAEVLALQFDRDPDRLLTRSRARIDTWQVSSGNLISSVTAPRLPVRLYYQDWNPVVPESQFLIDLSSQVQKWPRHPFEHAQQRVPRKLTDAEKSLFKVDLSDPATTISL